MDKVVNFPVNDTRAKEIVTFNDGIMCRKNDTKIYDVMLKIFLAFVIILIVGSLFFKDFLFGDESIAVWLCFFLVLAYLIKYGGHIRKECPAQLEFYDDYLIYTVKDHIKLDKDRLEIQKIFYKDVYKCDYRTNTRAVVICGMMEETYYLYNKNGDISNTPSFHKYYDGMIKFYTVFDDEHDFKEMIETNTPLKVEYQDA